MCKIYRRLIAGVFAALMLVTLFPFQAFAVDPVSAVTMANALAQAITAYGASQGVSMTFDVASTDGIGEGVRDLWDQFKADVNDNNVPTYDSLAVTIWSTLFKKVGNKVAIYLDATSVSYFDGFWNWLLSGPAEMTKVDNEYYEWSINQNGTVTPISISSIDTFSYNGISINALPLTYYSTSANVYASYSSSVSDTFFIPVQYSGSSSINIISVHYGGSYSLIWTRLDSNWSRSDSPYNFYSSWYFAKGLNSIDVNSCYSVPYNSNADADTVIRYIFGSDLPTPTSSNYTSDTLSVAPYIGETSPDRIYIPDNEDVNYQPLPYIGALDIPWSSEWGDGETVTDAQGTSIAAALDDVIVDDGTLELEGDNTVNPPIDEVIGGPDDYQVPGLADVFPFCIPFDIYNFLTALAAEPTPPHFTATLAFPEAVGGSQQIDIDFDTPMFNQIAAILRTMELLAFCIGLALLTRSMFIRG